MNTIYRFGLFEANPATREILRQGTRVRLQEQPFRVLLLLLENHDRIVTRDELRQQLWAENTYVEFDSSLRVAVGKLRDALGDDAENPRFVITVPRLGYRFLAPVTIYAPSQTPPTSSSRSPEQNFSAASGSSAEVVSAVPSNLKRRQRWFWAGIAAAVLSLGLIFVARYYRPAPAYALANSDTILLADFVNKSGDATFDDTLKQALAISLSQSPFLNLVPDHKVNETLKLMGRAPEQRLTGETALEVCQRTGSKAALEGSIASLGNQYVIGIAAVNCQTGAVFAQEQVQVSRKEDVLKSLGQASTHLRQTLGESLSTIQKFDIPLEQATTTSFDALKAFSIGQQVRNTKGPADSVPYLKHAIELDHGFALAYGVLSTAYLMMGEDGLGSDAAQKAYDLRSRVTERENFAITTYHNNFVLGDRIKALQNCKLWADSYPRDLSAYICLFFDTEIIGQYDKSLPEGLQCVAVDPDAGACYADLITNYAVLNHLEESKAIYERARARKLEGADIHGSRYYLAFIENDDAEMARQLAWASGRPAAETELWSAQSNTEAFHGHFGQARDLSRRAAESAARNDEKESAERILIQAAFREAIAGNFALARQQTASALSAASFEYLRSVAAVTLACAGDSGQAAKIANALDKTYPSDTMLHAFWLPTIRAEIEINRNHPALALELLRPAAPFELGEHIPLLPAYVRGQAYLAAAQDAAAAAEFQKLIDHNGLVANSLLGSLAHLGLARAYAQQAQSSHGAERETALAKARAAYRDFLQLWQDADTNLLPLQQARSEYAKIR